MDTPGAAVALLVVAIAIIGAAAGAQLALEDTGDNVDVTETVSTGAVGDTVVLNESNQDGVFYDRDVHVTNDTGERMVQGSDFTWHDRNGTLTVQSTALSSQSNATVDYGYSIPTQSQRTVASWIASLTSNLGIVLPIIFILVLLFMGITLMGGLS
jgi:hypothetical protein